MLGHLVGYVGFHGGLWNEKFNPNRKRFRLRFILGALEGLCRTNVGPFWVYVGSFGGLTRLGQSTCQRECRTELPRQDVR